MCVCVIRTTQMVCTSFSCLVLENRGELCVSVTTLLRHGAWSVAREDGCGRDLRGWYRSAMSQCVTGIFLSFFGHWGLGADGPGGPRHNIDLEISLGRCTWRTLNDISMYVFFSLNWRVLHHYVCRISTFLICLLVFLGTDMMGSKHWQLNSIAKYGCFTWKTIEGLIFPISLYFTTDKIHHGYGSIWVPQSLDG